MSNQYDYYAASGREPLSAEELEAVRGQLRILGRTLERLLPRPADPAEAMDSLDRKCSRLRGAGIQLQRLAARAIAEESDDDEGGRAPQFKRRLPRVMKSLATPAESRAFLRDAAAALRSGTFGTWAARRRREMAADFF